MTQHGSADKYAFMTHADIYVQCHPPFHGENTGSSPVGRAKHSKPTNSDLRAVFDAAARAAFGSQPRSAESPRGV
jgi:hypothetical protein